VGAATARLAMKASAARLKSFMVTGREDKLWTFAWYMEVMRKFRLIVLLSDNEKCLSEGVAGLYIFILADENEFVVLNLQDPILRQESWMFPNFAKN
jgi:hypothetical protein